MTQESTNIQIIITSILLFGVILLFELTSFDIQFQNYFFNFETSKWIIDKDEPILRLFLYDGLKKVLIAFALFIAIALIFFRKKELIKRYKKGLLIVLLSSILVPLTIGGLKAVTNMPCPKNIEHFKGNYPDIKLFESYPTSFKQEKRIKCWPAGHASGGFALLSLFFLFKSRKNKLIALGGALSIALAMGLYKMLIGDHFLSHTIVTMLIAWCEILLISKLIQGKDIEKSA
jgi:membrane-associated PAP2 superfamily phosphatase